MRVKSFLVWTVALIVTVISINVAFRLLSSQSDLKVLVGEGIIVGIIALYIPTIHRVVLRISSWRGNRLSIIIFAAISLTVLNGCTRVEPGYVGIKVNYYGTDKGVDNFPQVTGIVWFNPFTTKIFQYPTFVQTAIWTKDPTEGSPSNEEISFNAKEGLAITADISLSHQLKAEKVPNFYVKFRSDNIALYTHGFLRNIARDAFNEIAPRYTTEEIYGQKKEQLLKDVREYINQSIAPFGDHLEQFGFVGALRFPPSVIEALNGKITAIQNAMRVENEIRESEATAKKRVVQAEGEAKAIIVRANGDAQANKVLGASITSQLLQWQQLQITSQAVAKWNGQRPMVEGSDSGLLLQIPVPAQK